MRLWRWWRKNIQKPHTHSIFCLFWHAGFVHSLLLLILLHCSLNETAIAQDNAILILYPRTVSPYAEVYQQIIEGIRSSTKLSLNTMALPKDYNLKKIQRWIDGNNSNTGYLVVLGKRAYQASQLLNHKHTLLTGALDRLPGTNRTPGVTIHIDPSQYLEHLLTLSPDVTQLTLFYNQNNEDLIPLILEISQQKGIKITPVAVTDIETAIRQIGDALKNADPSKSAIWFTQNVIGLNTELLFPYILDISWRKRIPVFSGLISHTKRGFLFSLYPDYYGIGEELGEIIVGHKLNKKINVTQFTQSTKFILNTRTAQHLGLAIGDSILKKADVIFPAK
jgi:putative ABC transport system substrate-binding protein